MKHNHVVDTIAFVLLLIGGLNWGLVGLFDWDVIASIFGFMSVVTRVVYVLIGLSAVWRIIRLIQARSK